MHLCAARIFKETETHASEALTNGMKLPRQITRPTMQQAADCPDERQETGQEVCCQLVKARISEANTCLETSHRNATNTQQVHEKLKTRLTATKPPTLPQNGTDSSVNANELAIFVGGVSAGKVSDIVYRVQLQVAGIEKCWRGAVKYSWYKVCANWGGAEIQLAK
jgi:hypothetical protein